MEKSKSELGRATAGRVAVHAVLLMCYPESVRYNKERWQAFGPVVCADLARIFARWTYSRGLLVSKVRGKWKEVIEFVTIEVPHAIEVIFEVAEPTVIKEARDKAFSSTGMQEYLDEL